MNAAARWRGRPAEEQTGDGCAIQRGSGTKKELPEIHHATREIPPIRLGFRCSRAEVGQRFEQGAVLAAVAGIEIGHGIVDRMLEQYCGAIVQRMSAGSYWLYPGYLDGKRSKEGARDSQWIDRGPEVVTIPWQRDLRPRTCTTDLSVAFDDRGREASGRNYDRR